MMIDLSLVAEPIEASELPSHADFVRWIEAALTVAGDTRSEVELAIKVVDSAESQALNAEYRDKDKPTNVLSFVADVPEFIDLPLLGDLVICAPVVVSEAAQQSKPVAAHWAHLTIHGCLHLLGFDHIEDADAEVMEQLEITALEQLGIANPYLSDTQQV